MVQRRCRVWLALAGLTAAGALTGCVETTREHLFSGRAVTHVAAAPDAPEPAEASEPEVDVSVPVDAQGRPLRLPWRTARKKPAPVRQSAPEEISVQGWVMSRPQGRSLSLTFSNESGTVIPMSGVVDEYTAKTVDGRAVPLDVDFFTYPQALNPGEEQTVTLPLPRDLPPREITQITAKLNQGKAVAVLRAIGPTEPPAWRVGTPSAVMIDEPARSVRMDPAQSPMRPIPEILEPVGPVAPRSEAPVGTVPVTVEFEQPLGTALRADVFWNDRQDAVTLASGEHQLFYVKPGQHQLHVVSQLPFLMKTHARVPVVVSATAPVKVDVSAQAKLSGVALRVRVFHGQKVSIDQTFSPLSNR